MILDTTLTIRLSKELIQQAKQKACADDVTISAVTRQALAQYLQQEKGNGHEQKSPSPDRRS